MNADLLKDFTCLHRNVGEENVDHKVDGGTNSNLNLAVGAVQ
jgi:hypothetical protein